MGEDADSYTQAEIVRLLKGIQKDMGDLRTEMHAFSEVFVTRAELTAWQTAYDSEIHDMKDDAKPVKVSGWTIAAFAVTAVVGLGSLLGLTITLITVLR